MVLIISGCDLVYHLASVWLGRGEQIVLGNIGRSELFILLQREQHQELSTYYWVVKAYNTLKTDVMALIMQIIAEICECVIRLILTLCFHVLRYNSRKI